VDSRYAFRSEEKVALQEIGPRFTLKLRSLRKGLPAVQKYGEAPKTTEIQVGVEEMQDESQAREGVNKVGGEEGEDKAEGTGEDEGLWERAGDGDETSKAVIKPPTQDEFLWVWKVRRSLLFVQ
jgi:ribosome production factor 1